MVSCLHSLTLNGLEPTLTEVEVGFSRGIPGITIVGLPDNAIKESRERIKLAIKNAGFDYPVGAKIVINLSPADIRKEGSSLDLPIAVGILNHQYHLKNELFKKYLFAGELNLNGELNPVKGILNLALFAKYQGYKGIVIPFKNGKEASFVSGVKVYALKDLNEVMTFILNPGECQPFVQNFKATVCELPVEDFSEIKGQYLAKRVMEIAAAGFHNILMIGPPGSGKSMMAKALPSILPDMEEEEVLETSLIYSASGLLNQKQFIIQNRPFRSPHHTISDVGITGGGKYPIPGEISLAHNGVLFLDELPYFKKTALEVLRQPLEDGKITISRSLTTHTFPAKFMLVAAMNPCEDSIGMERTRYFQCTESQRRHYYSKISKPLLDRIDLQIEVKKVKIDEITSKVKSECSGEIKKRVVRARQLQLKRFSTLGTPIFANGQMSNKEIKRTCTVDTQAEQILKNAINKLNLSARSYFKILKISRTIADLANAPEITPPHIQEALQYRTLDLFHL